MSERDLEKLLGGFAADTLTTDEKQQLYRAALHDQELFNALADEQALRELLADPIVRRRLLQSLPATSSSPAGSSPSWSDWLFRPAGLAWASGFAAAALAVILGTKIYQDALKETDRSAIIEETPPVSESPAAKPEAPLLSDPQMNSPDKMASAGQAKKEAPTRKMEKREDRRTQDSEADGPLPKPKEDGLRRQAESISDKFAQSKETAEVTEGQSRTTPATPLPPASSPVPIQPSADNTTVASGNASAGARSMYYGTLLRPDAGMIVEDQKRVERPAGSSDQRLSPLEMKTERLAAAKTKDAPSMRPLGIRYHLKTGAPPEQNRGAATDDTRYIAPLRLTIESNQAGYLQVWGDVGSLEPHLLFPLEGEERARSKLVAHQRLTISQLITSGNLAILFSREPFGDTPTLNSVRLDRSSRNQLRESIVTDEVSGSPEEATYVVNRDASFSDIMILVPMPQP